MALWFSRGGAGERRRRAPATMPESKGIEKNLYAS